MEATDANTTLVAAMVDGAHLQSNRSFHLHLGSRNLLQDGIEQRNHVHIAVFGVEAGIAVYRRGVHYGEVELFIGGAKLNHKVEHLVDRTFRIRIRAVYLVHNHYDTQAELQGVRQDETSLRFGSFVGVDDKQGTVRHIENTLYFSAEIGMSRRVDDVNLGVLVSNGDVLGQNGNAALSLLIVAVEHAFLDLLVAAKDVGGKQQAIDHRGLAMVDVGDDGHVSKLFLFHGYSSSHSSSMLRFCSSISFRCSFIVEMFWWVEMKDTMPHITKVPEIAATHTIRLRSTAPTAPAAIMMRALRRSS